MGSIVTAVAIIGIAALAYRLLRALAGFGLAMAEVAASAELAKLSSRRGDLTTLSERRTSERIARRRRVQDALLALTWLGCLVLPPFTPWTQALYAAAAPLWFLPYHSVRFGQKE